MVSFDDMPSLSSFFHYNSQFTAWSQLLLSMAITQYCEPVPILKKNIYKDTLNYALNVKWIFVEKIYKLGKQNVYKNIDVGGQISWKSTLKTILKSKYLPRQIRSVIFAKNVSRSS